MLEACKEAVHLVPFFGEMTVPLTTLKQFFTAATVPRDWDCTWCRKQSLSFSIKWTPLVQKYLLMTYWPPILHQFWRYPFSWICHQSSFLTGFCSFLILVGWKIVDGLEGAKTTPVSERSCFGYLIYSGIQKCNQFALQSYSPQGFRQGGLINRLLGSNCKCILYCFNLRNS